MITFTVCVARAFVVSESIAGTTLDSLEFARSGGVLERNVGLDQLPRLADLLATGEGVLSVRIAGSRAADGTSWLDVEISGEPVLCCQRCLGGVSYPLEIASRLQLIAPGEDWPDDDLADDSADAIVAEKELAVLSLIEDEVLLALPIAPTHEQACEPPSAVAFEPGASPFAALAALKKH